MSDAPLREGPPQDVVLLSAVCLMGFVRALSPPPTRSSENQEEGRVVRVAAVSLPFLCFRRGPEAVCSVADLRLK